MKTKLSLWLQYKKKNKISEDKAFVWLHKQNQIGFKIEFDHFVKVYAGAGLKELLYVVEKEELKLIFSRNELLLIPIFSRHVMLLLVIYLFPILFWKKKLRFHVFFSHII